MSIETLAPYLAGPGAGLLICVLIGLGAYKLMISHVLPIIKGAVERHLQQIDEMQARWDAADQRRSEEHQKILECCIAMKSEITRWDSAPNTHPGV